MRYFVYVSLIALAPGIAWAQNNPGDANPWQKPASLRASISLSTSAVINGVVMKRPQLGFNLSGEKAALYYGASVATVDNNLGSDSQDQLYAGYRQSLGKISIRYQATYRSYPGTLAQFNDSGLTYQVTASRSLLGVNASLGAEYSDTDFANVRKSYGLNGSISHGLIKNMSGWLSLSYHKQWGGVDSLNTNIGLWYQMTPKLGISASVNNWHAYAAWNHDRPTLSLGISRTL